MSSIRQRSDGFYFLDIRQYGERKRIALNTRDRRLAVARAKIAERDILGSQITSRVTLDQFRDEYLTYAESRSRPQTLKAYRFAFERLRTWGKVTYIDTFDRRMADAFVTELITVPLHPDKRPKPVKPVTANFYLRTLKAVFNVALSWKYIDENPFKGIKLLQVDRLVPRIIQPEEIARLMTSARTMAPEYSSLFEFYLLTGLRESEALTLEWTDIDLAKRTMILRTTKSHVPRQIFLAPRAVRILQERSGNVRPFPYTRFEVFHRFKRAAAAAGIPFATIHMLRKTFASYIQDVGMPTLFVTWLVGHTDDDVTRKHYTGFDQKMVEGYLKRLEKKLLPQGKS